MVCDVLVGMLRLAVVASLGGNEEMNLTRFRIFQRSHKTLLLDFDLFSVGFGGGTDWWVLARTIVLEAGSIVTTVI